MPNTEAQWLAFANEYVRAKFPVPVDATIEFDRDGNALIHVIGEPPTIISSHALPTRG